MKLSARWLHDRQLPAKAIDVLDRAGSHSRRHGKRYVSRRAVAEVVAQAANVPLDRLVLTDVQRLGRMEAFLRENIVAHGEEVARIARVIRRNFAGFVSGRPVGSFLFLGPTGVGKTESAKVLADFLFGSREALTRFDMSEYMDSHSVSRLIGSPPGYVGHDEGGQLTEAVRRRPYQIVLFDEVEKASGDILNILLQLLEEGELTDGRGRRVRFNHAVVFMTSNVGHEHFNNDRRQVGFGGGVATDDVTRQVLETARRSFSPELWNRIEEKLVYRSLEQSHVELIAKLLLKRSSDRLHAERGIRYVVTDRVVPFLVARGGYDRRHGARPMRRTLQEHVEGAVADAILTQRYPADTCLSVDIVDDKVLVSGP